MRYKIGRGIVVKTENAAKPASQGSKFLKEFMAQLPFVSSSFDYGCGKLRYLDDILGISETLVVVDSEIQLSRTQRLKRRTSTVRQISASSNRITVQNDVEFKSSQSLFDRGFCINVLSVIPFFSERKRVLHTILQKLRPGGTCLFVVQYRNSDFTRMRSMKNAIPWRDGFLIDSLRGYSFYGLITPERLAAMLLRAGFDVVSQVLHDGSVFIVGMRPPVRSTLYPTA